MPDPNAAPKPDPEALLAEAQAAFERSAKALRDALEGPGAALPFRLRASSSRAAAQLIEREAEADAQADLDRDEWKNAFSSWNSAQAAVLESHAIFFDEEEDAEEFLAAPRSSLSKKALADLAVSIAARRKAPSPSQKTATQARRLLRAKTELYLRQAEAVSREAAIVLALSEAFSGRPVSDPRLLSAPIPVSSFRDKALKGLPSGEYSCWELGLLCGDAFAASEGARCFAAARRPLGKIRTPPSEWAGGERPSSLLLSALKAPAEFRGLCPTSSSAGIFGMEALHSARLAIRGLASDPADLLSRALPGLGDLMMPFAEASLAPAARAGRNPMAWGEFAKEHRLPGPEPVSVLALACERAFLPQAQAGSSFPALAGWARAREALWALSGQASAASAPSHRQSMLLSALRHGDLPAAEAMAALGAGLRDPAGLDISDLDAPLPESEPAQIRAILSSFPVPEPLLALAARDPDPWSCLGALDALSATCLSLRSLRKPNPAHLEPLAFALRDSEPFPGAAALALRSLHEAIPSPTLRIVSEALSLEASSPKAASRSRPKSL